MEIMLSEKKTIKKNHENDICQVQPRIEVSINTKVRNELENLGNIFTMGYIWGSRGQNIIPDSNVKI